MCNTLRFYQYKKKYKANFSHTGSCMKFHVYFGACDKKKASSIFHFQIKLSFKILPSKMLIATLTQIKLLTKILMLTAASLWLLSQRVMPADL